MTTDTHSPFVQAEAATAVFSQPVIDAEHPRSIFVTVGSTGFDTLVHTVMSTPFLRAALQIGYRRITVQYGHSKTAFMAALSHRDTDESVRYHFNALTNELVIRWLNNNNNNNNNGNDFFQRVDTSQLTMTVSGFDFRPSLAGDIRLADLIISHAGSGSIIEALRRQKPLISELALALHKQGHLIAADCDELVGVLDEQRHVGLLPLPPQNPQIFSDILGSVIQFKRIE
ncbi:hypothetical protein BDF22DRAFT_671854 [Syncephalis plumigaleata]|nr:hypothetical protein BDF22DRAFT_671854 [Syncephalis plumigaleata]